jgi:hypothetical protein
MTELPYTEADLRYEAARQYAIFMDDPEFMSVGEMMEDSEVQSLAASVKAGGDDPYTYWGTLLPYNHDDGNAYNKAQREIHSLITNAADLSEWAVEMGADDLRPERLPVDVKNVDGITVMRAHFAFAPHISEAKKNALVSLIAAVLDGQGD